MSGDQNDPCNDDVPEEKPKPQPDPAKRIRCHMCGCDQWYDPNGNGLCDATDWNNPHQKCGHPITAHY